MKRLTTYLLAVLLLLGISSGVMADTKVLRYPSSGAAPQPLDTTDSPTFGGLTLTGFTGGLTATAGVVSGGGILVPAGATGDIMAFSAPSTPTTIADVALGQVLASGGIGAIPAYTGSPSLTGLLIGNGLVGTPALRFSSDTDTGIYRIADNSLGIAIGGSLWETIGPTGFTNEVSMIAATGNEVAYTFNYTTAKAAGNDTGLLISMTDSGSPGTSLPLDIQVGAASKWKVDNAGAVTQAGSITGTTTLTINPGSSAALNLNNNSSSGTGIFTAIGGGTYTRNTGNQTVCKIGPTFGAPTGNMDGAYTAFTVTPTYNQTATGGSSDGSNYDLVVDRTETALAGGTQRLASFQVSAVERLGFDNKGIEYFAPTDFTGTPVAATAPLKAFRYNKTLADDDIITCPSITSAAFGWITAGNNIERSMIWIDNDGDVTLLNNSANVVANANTDANLCIGTAATQEPLLIRNRLGGPYVINLVLFYD